MKIQRLILSSLLMVGLVACGETPNPQPTPEPEPETSAPAISELSDQTVVQNTQADAATLSLPFTVSDEQDAPSALEVAAAVDGDASATPSCDENGGCRLAVEVARSQALSATIKVTVTDTDGDTADSSLTLNVAPRLVTSAADSGTASLRETIAEAEPGDIIGFDTEGEFADQQTVELSSQLTVVKNLDIRGPGADKLSLDGAGTHRIFNVKDATVSLSGMTLTGGLGQDGNASTLSLSIGGAIVNRSTLTLKDMVLAGNKAELGGAIYNAKGAELTLKKTTLGGATANEASRSGGAIFNESRLTIQDSTLSGNTAGRYAGALYNHEKETVVTIEASKLNGNEAQSSSAMVNGALAQLPDDTYESRAGTLTIRDSEVNDNRSVPLPGGTEGRVEGSNGAISNFGPLEIYNSTFEANESPSGSALYNQFLGTALLDKVSFLGNVSSFNAGAIFNEGTVKLQNGTLIKGNSAVNSGGGILNEFGLVDIPAGNTVTENTADSDEDGNGTGGGVYTSAGNTVAAENTVFSNTPNDLVNDKPTIRLARPSGISHRP